MSGRGTVRLFVAIDLPRAVREALAAWARGALSGSGIRVGAGPGGPLRLLEPETLHLTLCFLGDRPAQEVDAIDAALDAGATSVGELSVGAPLWLPAKRPRALAVEVHDRAGELGRLHDAVTRGIAGATAWEPERRRFRAHITLARVRARGRSAQALLWQTSLPATPRLRFQPQSLTLYSSRLAPGGALHEPLASSRLLPGEL